MPTTKNLNGARAAAEQYATFDRTDPYAYNRAMSHMNNGVAKWTEGEWDYGAEIETDEATGNVQIKNVRRP